MKLKAKLLTIIITSMLVIAWPLQAISEEVDLLANPSGDLGATTTEILEDTGPKPAWMQYNTPYLGEYNNLSKAHRTTYEISTWSQHAIANVLSFTPDNYQDRLRDFKKYFVKNGWIKYAQFLKSSYLLNYTARDGYSVGTLVNSRPEIINKGATDNIYHWIIKMPITISIFRVSESGDIKTKSADPYILYMDLMRTAPDKDNNNDDDGIAIYDWRVDEDR